MHIPRLLLLLSLPGIVQAGDPAPEIRAAVKDAQAKLSAYRARLLDFVETRRPIAEFPGSLAPEIQACRERLKTESRPGMRETLTVAMVSFQAMDVRGHAKGEPDPVQALAGIGPLAPGWAIQPDLVARAAHAMGDPEARAAFVAAVQERHPDPAVRMAMLYASFLDARRGGGAGAEAILAAMEKVDPGSDQVKKARAEKRMDTAVQVGKPAPGFKVPSLDDPAVTFTLDTFKGKYLLLDFWATWCVPCRAMLPVLHKLQADARERGLEILSVANDRGPDVVKAFRAKPGTPMPWRNTIVVPDLRDPSRMNPIMADYGVRALPTMVLVGPDGTVLAAGEELHRDLEKVLARFLPLRPDPALEPLKKEMLKDRAALIEAIRTHRRDSGASPDAFKADLETRLRPLRALAGGGSPELRQAGLVAEYVVASAWAVPPELRKSLLEEVPPDAQAWSLAVDQAPRLLEDLGEEARPYVDRMKAGAVAPVRAAMVAMDALKLVLVEGKVEEAAPMVEGLLKAFPGDPNVVKVARILADARKTAVGAPAPAFRIPDLEDAGRTFTLESFRGKYLLLDFWGTWCGFCIKELPATQKLYAAWHPKGLEILSLASDNKPEDVARFRTKPEYPMPWHHGFLGRDKEHPHAMVTAFGIVGYPSLFLIGPDGKLLARGMELRGENLAATLAKFIHEP